VDSATDSRALEVMTVEDVAEYLSIPRSFVYQHSRQGRIPCHKVGRHWRFRREAMERWLDPGERTEGTHYGQA